MVSSKYVATGVVRHVGLQQAQYYVGAQQTTHCWAATMSGYDTVGLRQCRAAPTLDYQLTSFHDTTGLSLRQFPQVMQANQANDGLASVLAY